MSTTLPLPSSPHCVPTTTMLGMASTPEYTLWMLEDFIHGQYALRSIRKIHRDDLTRPGARVADDEHCPDALRPRVGDRLLEPAADDIASDRGPQVAEPARQRERRRLLASEVDDEEVGSRQRHGNTLRLHHREGPAHVEREPDRRAVVPEASEHVVVAATPGDRSAEPRHVRLEVGARVVVKSTNLAQVEQHALGEPIDLEQPVYLGEVRQ